MDAETGKLFLILELGAESLEERLASHAAAGTTLSVEELRNVHWSLVSIVCGLHGAGFVHMDIKPANVVRFGDTWKLIDFDGAVKSGTRLPREKMTFTPLYMPPEAARVWVEDHQELQASRLMDVWSVGMCAIEAVFLQPVMKPWYDEWTQDTGNDRKFFAWLADYDASPAIMDSDMCEAMAQIHPDLCSLLQGMLVKDPSKRSDIAECWVHDWFEPIRVKLWKGLALASGEDSNSSLTVQRDRQERQCRKRGSDTEGSMGVTPSMKAAARTCAVM